MNHLTLRAVRPFLGALTRRCSLQWLALIPFFPYAKAAPAGVQLASEWLPSRSPQGFLVSEKFDGVRAVWDGQRLRFRSGREIAAPLWFVRALPDHPLDGELWMGRGQFDRLSGVVRQQQPNEAAWRDVRYLVFDAPGQPDAFEVRWQALASVIEGARQPWLQRVEQFRVRDATALQQRLQALVQAGGEGLVLHQAKALWRAGRSPEGHTFAIGSGLSDALRREPPPLGAWVTYRYRDRTPKGMPRFATFVRVRAEE